MSVPTTSDAAVALLVGTARTDRCQNAFFRQQQLKSLHDILRNNVAQLRDAIKKDDGVTDAEATTEIAVVLGIVKEHYKSIDPQKEIQNEYQVAHKKDFLKRTVPWGVVYIEPALGHTPVFNILSPLSAAIVAGNCVALKVRAFSVFS